MWQLQQVAPGVFHQLDVPVPDARELAKGEVLLRFLAGSICGSDLPKFLGEPDPDNPYIGLPGVPLHEVVGRVVASRSTRLQPGQRVVGIIAQSRGLSEFVINPAELLHPINNELSDVQATVIQPVATVLSSLSRTKGVLGRKVAVLGLGSLGILFAHIAKHQGSGNVVGIDRVDRSAFSSIFGIDEVVVTDTHKWATSLCKEERPDLVIDAIGHRQEIMADAIASAAPGAEVVAFGLPEDHYVFPMRQFFRKGLRLVGGVTQNWSHFLNEGERYVLNHPVLQEEYITDILSVLRAEEAMHMHMRPSHARLKIALTPP